MLSAAMRFHGADSSETLMVGYDFVDLEAASRAGVDYIDQQHLIGVERFDCGFDQAQVDERVVSAGVTRGVRAPGSFAAAAKRKAGEQLPRSPNKAAR
jgi:phosphoglycolate phosphatase-like HAD superfamily hydrolase